MSKPTGHAVASPPAESTPSAYGSSERICSGRGRPRARWRRLKDAGHELTYWQQTPQGGWEKKA